MTSVVMNHGRFTQSYTSAESKELKELNWDEYDDLALKVISTGLYAHIGTTPYAITEDYIKWYRSSETIGGTNPYVGHLVNKKWPLKKVL